MVLQDFHCNMENYSATSKNCTTQALNSDAYPISHIPYPRNFKSLSKQTFSCQAGLGKKWSGSWWETQLLYFLFFHCLFRSFNWRIIDLQCCGGFCRTTPISRVCPSIPLLWSLPPTSQPLGHQSAGLSAVFQSDFLLSYT